MRKLRKKASIIEQTVTQIILIALVFGLFFVSITAKTNSRGVKQQVLEKELAMMIEASIPGTEILIPKTTIQPDKSIATINSVKADMDSGRVYVGVNGLKPWKGKPFFTKYKISVNEDVNNFIIKIE